MKNKKGSTNKIFYGIGFALVFILAIGVFAYFSNQLNTALMSVEGLIGQVNFSESVSNTWGKFNTGLLNSLNFMGLSLIFGMFGGLVLNAYFNRERRPTIFFIGDLLIIFIAFIFSGYVSDSYVEIIGVGELSTIFVDNMNLVAKAMINLPILTLVFGIIIMIISFSGIPLSRNETQMAGY